MNLVVVTAKEKFLLFDNNKGLLNSFTGSLMQGNADYVNLLKVCRIIFLLSHDQANVKKGSNISGELLVENINELLLISQRAMCDHFFTNRSDLHSYQVDRKLLLSCKGARIKCDSYLENE